MMYLKEIGIGFPKLSWYKIYMYPFKGLVLLDVQHLHWNVFVQCLLVIAYATYLSSLLKNKNIEYELFWLMLWTTSARLNNFFVSI